MRLLPFVRRGYPGKRIIGYSDAAGAQGQLELLRLNPLIDEVRVVRQRPGAATWDNMGDLNNLLADDLALLRGADHFFDTWSKAFFVPAAWEMGVPVFSILARRPRLVTPAWANEAAAVALSAWEGKRLVGLNVIKHGMSDAELPQRIMGFLQRMLEDERVVVNLFPTRFDFSHWPAADAARRDASAQADLRFAEELCRRYPRIVPLIDLPIPVVAAVLKRCCYYVGLDNGIKHMAWALRVPHTLLWPRAPLQAGTVLRWIPDFHRALTVDSTPAMVEAAI